MELDLKTSSAELSLSPLCVSVREVQGGAAPAPQLQKTIWRSVFSRIQLQHQLARQLTSELVTPSEPYVHTCKQDFPSTRDRGKSGNGLIEFGVSCTILTPKSSQIIPNHRKSYLSLSLCISWYTYIIIIISHYIPLYPIILGFHRGETMGNLDSSTVGGLFSAQWPPGTARHPAHRSPWPGSGQLGSTWIHYDPLKIKVKQYMEKLKNVIYIM